MKAIGFYLWVAVTVVFWAIVIVIVWPLDKALGYLVRKVGK